MDPLIFSALSSEVVLFNCLSTLIMQLKSLPLSLRILFLGLEISYKVLKLFSD